MISGNYNNYNNQMNNIAYGAVKDVVPNQVGEKLPENIQNIDAQQIANNNGAVATTQNMNKQSALLTLPIYTSFVALRSINDKIKSPFSFAGEYESNFLGKLAKFGDKTSKLISKIIPDNIEYGIPKKLNQAKSWILDHSAIARSFTTPLKLENSTALQEANGFFGRIMMDNSTMFEKGFKGDIKNLFKGDGTSSFWNLLKTKGIEAASNEKATAIVKETFQELAQQPVKSKEVQQYAVDIIKTLSKSDEAIVIDKWGKLPIGKIPVIGKFFTLKVPMSEIANKVRVSAGISGNQLAEGATAAAVGTTALGKAVPSAFAKVYEGLTSDFVGGKIAPAIQAFFLASAALRAKDAPKGQKLATFMDEEVGGVTTLFTLPLATKILTHAGGLKYLGMGETVAQQAENVSKYKDMIKALNEKVDLGTITRGEYLDETKKIKDLLNGKINGKSTVKFWQKPFKAIGKILGANYEKETIKPFIQDTLPTDTSKLKALGIETSNKVQNLLYKFKTGKILGMSPAGILRFILVMFVISPIITKPIRWVVNKIFGEPYDANKAKEEEAKKAQEEAMKNNPFTKMTDQELLNLLSKNQDTLANIQKDPQLMQELQTNPQKLYDLLQEGVKKKNEALKNAGPSPMLQKYLNQNGSRIPSQNPYVQQPQISPSNGFNQPNMQQTMNINNGSLNQNSNLNLNTNATMPAPSIQQQNTDNEKKEDKIAEPKRTYIPSSKPAESLMQQKQAQDAKFNSIIADMDKTEQEFSKYLNI